jgi:hypothetical protein
METDDDEIEQEREQIKQERQKDRDFMGRVIVQAAAIIARVGRRRMNRPSGWRDRTAHRRRDEQSGPEDSGFQPIHPEPTTDTTAATTSSVPFVIRTTLHRDSSPAMESSSLLSSLDRSTDDDDDDDDTDDEEYKKLVDAVNRYTERMKNRAKLRITRQKLRADRTQFYVSFWLEFNTLTDATRELRLRQIAIATDDDTNKKMAIYDDELNLIDEEMEKCHKKRRNIERKINNIDASDNSD